MTAYSPQKNDAILPGARATTEWYSRVGGVIAGCGEAATAVMLGVMKGRTDYYDPNKVAALIQQAVAAHQTVGMWAAGGQSTANNLQWLAQQNGVQTTAYDGSQAGQLLASYAGRRPLVVGVSNARAFGGSDSNVNGHYVTVVGRTAQGDYIVSDPNTQESTQGQFVKYSAQQFQNAQPFAVVMPNADTSGVGAAAGTTLASTQGSTSGGSCKHSVSVAWGSICLDPALGFAVRSGLVLAGLLCIVLGIIILARTQPVIGQPLQAAAAKVKGYRALAAKAAVAAA